MLARWFQLSVGKAVPVKCWQGGFSKVLAWWFQLVLARWFQLSVGKVVLVKCWQGSSS